jgi:hypothetical protein
MAKCSKPGRRPPVPVNVTASPSGASAGDSETPQQGRSRGWREKRLWVQRWLRRSGARARPHWPFLLLLVVAGGLRLAVMLAYRPATLFADSRSYIQTAYQAAAQDSLGADIESLFVLSKVRPAGYSALINLLGRLTENLALVTILQHLAGLCVGIIVYVLLRHFDVGKWLATAAAAVVLLDGYAIALEQAILTETLFTLAIVSALSLTLLHSHHALSLIGSGLLLAGATMLRPGGVFVIGVWLLYLGWTRRCRSGLAGALAAIVPLVAYAGIFAAVNGPFSLTQSDGWFLYGRTAEIADCQGVVLSAKARQLCVDDRRTRETTPIDYSIWSRSSRANRVFGRRGPGHDSEHAAYSNKVLKEFSRAIVRERPLDYLRIVSRDFARFLLPGTSDPRKLTQLNGVAFPGQAEGSWTTGETEGSWRRLTTRRHDQLRHALRDAGGHWSPKQGPAYRLEIRPPARAIRTYVDIVHTDRLILGLMVLCAITGVALPRAENRREIILLLGAGLSLLLGTAATAAFLLRYLIPAVPLIVASGTLALASSARQWQRRPVVHGRL